MASTTIEPNRLKSRWPIAVRLAATFPLSDARIGVIVVPMLPPRIMAQPRENEIQPCEHIISVMAKVAAELCATIVTTMPSAKKISTDKNPIDVYPTMKLSISGFSSRFGTYSLMRSRPMKRKQKPTRNSPADL